MEPVHREADEAEEYEPTLFVTGTGHTDDGALTGTIFIRSGDIPDEAMMVGPSKELLDNPEASAQWPLLLEGFGILNWFGGHGWPSYH